MGCVSNFTEEGLRKKIKDHCNYSKEKLGPAHCQTLYSMYYQRWWSEMKQQSVAGDTTWPPELSSAEESKKKCQGKVFVVLLCV